MKLTCLNTVLIPALIVLGLSCTKNLQEPSHEKIKMLQKQPWILDSTNTITAFYTNMQPEVPSSIYNFEGDSLFVNYHGTTVIGYGIEYEAPNRAFFWIAGSTKNPNQFLVIDIVTEDKMIAREIDLAEGRTIVRFLHAQ